ncbi:Serine/threonine-protein kinase EDR1 (MAPKK kinase EDR1) (Protein ENHANCED DISEASE RESISTANCE 1) (AtEDR1) (Serine/threonine/tyrosine-protein kinase 10) [Durusdinium trenchii]|uniref:Serine/threonine-protein kinase EDR1 (MAPKK kinase EDR1) (Protein ENHANCED DISEASE RESISTANCE 1) (AtEDR1) (Serine/threonine/tyrosine-protein kinase 10) n=1 Tax=Durusdinium trenchii TaxID=1381693 RepID=A0ABP0QL59_9DINO
MAMTVNLLEVPAREEQSAMHVRREKMSEDAPEEEVRHDNLVKILDILFEGALICTVTEPAPRCLRQLLQAQPSLAQQQHLPLAHGIASAMACLHDLPEPILHQELKPENVLIFESASKLIPKITDVGFNGGHGVGALAYKAPEIFDGQFQAASEVYAFGVVCFEILTGQRAWEGRTDFQIMKAVGFDHERPHMDEQNAKTVLGKIIKDCWAPDPAARPRFAALPKHLKLRKLPAQLSTAVPGYWSGRGEDLEQGWAAIPVAAPTFAALRRLFVVTQPQDLGRGRDAGQYPRRYSNLQLWSAWQIEHHNLWEKYMAERNDVLRNLQRLERDSIETSVWKSKLEDASAGMPDELCAPIGEKYLLHGTLPEHLLHILDQGFNDKLASSKGMFGAGAYFAEDPEKIDQYTRPDPGYESPGLEDVHSRLYRPGGHQHPGHDVFYCFVARVTCGATFVTKALKDSAGQLRGGSLPKVYDFDSDFQVFANAERRELTTVPNSSPPVRYHTLLAELGPAIGRHREVISYLSNGAYPAFLLAYVRQ